MTTVSIYGQDVELIEIPDDETVLDVIVLTRTVWHNEDGNLEDALQLVSSPNTTSTIKVGMLTAAAKYETEGWADRGEDE